MAVQGAKPKEADQKVTRVPLTHDWTDVADVPYAGDVPRIGTVGPATKDWWSRLTKMPHCILWAPTDWRFAMDTALIHNAFSLGDLARAQELRVREKQMGTTYDARRDLRIRYVAVVEESEPEGGKRV